MRLTYAVVFEKGQDGYGIQVPELPGCFSAGDDLAHGRAMVKEAMALWLGCAAEDGDLIPEGKMALGDALASVQWQMEDYPSEELEKIGLSSPFHAEMIEVEVSLPKPVAPLHHD